MICSKLARAGFDVRDAKCISGPAETEWAGIMKLAWTRAPGSSKDSAGLCVIVRCFMATTMPFPCKKSR